MDIQFLKDLSPVAILAVVVLYAIKVFAPMTKTALEQIPASIKELTKFINSLIETMKEAQQESKANANAIGGLAEVTSQTGLSQTKALDLIADRLNTAMDRQKQYGELAQETRNNSKEALSNLMMMGKAVTGLEELLGATLGTVLDIQDLLKEVSERPAEITLEKIKELLEARLTKSELQMQNAIQSIGKPTTITVPEGTMMVDIQTEKKEVQP